MRKKILFIYTNYSTFVKTDFEILSTEHEVIKYQFQPDKGLIKTAYELLRQFTFLIFRIWNFDIIYIWFADYHSFLPVVLAKIFGKKSFVVIGGYDVANIPEIGYGSLTKSIRKTATLLTVKNATLCLPVVEKLEKRIHELCPYAKTQTIYTGYQFDNFVDHKEISKERDKIILSVSITENHQRYMVKGLDRFKQLSEDMPDFQFIIIGVKEKARKLFFPIPQNLSLLPPLKQNKLKEYYLQASFYAQFSRSEGLPNALCEAMLHGCIPIATKIGGIPTATGPFGLLINEWDLEKLKKYINNQHNNVNREELSCWIKKNFDLRFRKEKLLKLL